MSEIARWSYTAKATIWPLADTDRYGKPTFGVPVVIDCDYGGDGKRGSASFGLEFVVKNTFWTEYAVAKVGDMIALGEHADTTPVADADEVRHIIRYADTFERTADDYAVITGV
ncbi:hypothetical protein WCT81_04840 [Pectobacterium versatile]|uniref:hypothetical protein n=1 Tax=Pectobacterium versatile TaxID=2488639 RepID=UPI00208435C5|nr:hypothetical protein SOASR014_41670 [Pectobacterium carotovorum subsp. carotovorum]GLX46556.1 hypothetical protein Pcaca01_42240 [Pectobacterium carotovorum subsp. carotovorum]